MAISAFWIPGLAGLLGDENAHGYGNTFTLVKYGRKVESPGVGDLVFYNTAGPDSHVGVYVGDRVLGGGRTVGTVHIVDDGHEGGPFLNRLDRSPISQIRSYV